MKLLKNSIFAFVISSCCLTQLVMAENGIKETNKIRQYLYNSNVDFNSFSPENIAYYKSIIEDHIITLKQKSGASYNTIQGTILAGYSAVCGYFYYSTIIFPYIINIALSNRRGYAHAAEFNKDFIKDHPVLAVWYATPLFASLILGALSCNYFRKDRNDKKSLQAALLRDEMVLTRLEKAEQRK
jgi:hypothetical protein